MTKPDAYEFPFAMSIALLWRSGKMVGADEDKVRNALLDEIERQTTSAQPIDKLKELMRRCKCGVHVTVNDHRTVYMTAADMLAEMAERECPPEIEEDVRAKMIETDTIINVHFYPTHPVTFYEVYHHDLDAALDEALACTETGTL